MTEIFENCLTAFPVFYRTYSRVKGDKRETWGDVCTRTTEGLTKLGKLTKQEAFLIYDQQAKCRAMTSGRYLWVGGTEWSEQPENFPGVYNCSSTAVDSWETFSLIMDVTMMGCGAGAMLEPKYINQLPPIVNKINLSISRPIGERLKLFREEDTSVKCDGSVVTIHVGDSRQGWVDGYTALLETASAPVYGGEINVEIDLSSVRPAGERLKGFGGISSPVLLPDCFINCAKVLNKAVGRQLNSLECCLLIDHAALCIVAGNIRRCLPSGSLVHTQSGLVPIEKVRIGDRVLTSKGFYPVTNFFDQGEQSLCRVITEDGYLECTPDHKIAVLQDVYGTYKMVKAKDIKPDDRLIFVPEQIAGSATELPEFDQSILPNGTANISIPALTSDIAYLIGYLHGNGCVYSSGHRVGFAVPTRYKKILSKLIDVVSLFGTEKYTLVSPERTKAQSFELIFNSSALNKYFSLFKKPKESIAIPDCILLGTKEIREGYLTGLADADGCHSQNVLVASVYSDFLKQVRCLYSSLGITVRLCSSIRKRNNAWEGELVTVGESAYDSVDAFMMKYSPVYPEAKREKPKSFKDHGFPKEMARPLINTYTYGWGNNQKQMIAPTLKKILPQATELIPVKVKEILFDTRVSQTYDIEVATIHEFVCEGVLVSNSAGIKQSSDDDHVFTTAKDNLWQQDEHGHWSIDPERDALRMSNHTRVFHKKPTRDEVLHAVNKQYYSGEGAIQWVGESIARANCDLPISKQVMIEAYENGTLEDLIRQSMPGMDDKEISHRLQRYGLNPCLTADNWVLTADGPRTVLDLVGEKFDAVIHSDTVPSDDRGFWLSGIKEVYKLQTEEGFSIRLTDNHKLLKANGEWVEVKDLQEGDQLLLHNHRGRFDEICFEWLSQNLLKAEGLTLQSDMELPLFLTGNKEHLETIQRYLIWSGVFSTIEATDKKSSLVIRGDNQEALRELITYYFHKDESALIKNNKPVIATVKSIDYEGEEAVYDCFIPDYHYLDCNGFVTHNCGEIIMYNNFCNLGEVHLNLLDPKNEQEQFQAFKAAALSVAALLHHEFVPERYQYSREVDPIVGVSFTGLFDFFVNAFGVDWLKWWEAGRPEYFRLQVKTPEGLVVENACVYFKEQEQEYLKKWKMWVHDVIWEYCDRHDLRRPNRCTTVQPSGSKSLLTGASPGWHPPKSQRFIRRITFRRDDPVALACIDYGYNVIPSQSDKDENGKLLNDPYDPRCTEWLVEIPVEVNWANIPGADTIDISKLSVLAQFDFYMQVQKYYTSHNSSATLEFRENEIEPLADRIYQAIRDDEGYISAALLARFDDLQTFPRLPFEPTSKEVYERMVVEMKLRQKTTDFHEALQKYDFGDMFEAGPAGCDSDKCLIGTIKK